MSLPNSDGNIKASAAWLHLVAAPCIVLLTIGLTLIAPPPALSAASSEQGVGACVLQLGDVTGDGLPDFSVSVPGIRNGMVVVYLIAGRNEPFPAQLDPSYLRQNLAGVLRGPAAMPFVCPAAPVPLAHRIGGPAKVRRRQPGNTSIYQPVSYTMIDLDPLMPGASLGLSSTASGINAGGQVVGSFFTQQGEHAFVYNSGEVRDLGTLGGQSSAARGINDAGEIVGYSLNGATDNFGFINEAFAFDGFVMRGLNIDWSAALANNDAGQIVGEMRITPGVDLNHAFLYEEGTATDLGSLPPLATSAYSTANSINEAGKIVGASNTFVLGSLFPSRRYPAVRAFVYEHGAMRDLGSLGVRCEPFVNDERCFENSVATDINNSGAIVGFSSTTTNLRGHAFLSDGQQLQDLGALGGSASWAYGVNDSGQIVGGFSSADDSYLAPFLYERGTMYDLKDLIVNPSAALPFAAYDINNFGQIVGNHHVLHPLYEHVAPGRALAFTSALGQTLGFAYWVSRANVGACDATTSRLRLQVRFEVPGEIEGTWIPAAVVRDCGDSTDWQAVSVEIPPDRQAKNGVVHIRVRQAGPATEPSVFLRHFSMR